MTGEKTALRAAVDAYEADDEEIQLELEQLGLPVNAKVVAIRERTGKPGRRKGSRNRRTEAMAQYLLAKYRHPLERLAQIYSAPTEELAASLGCTKLEALAEQRLSIIAALPYVQPKLPLAVDLTNHKVITLTINEDPHVAGNAGEDNDEIITLTATVLKDGVD
jgi:hypothetical protein